MPSARLLTSLAVTALLSVALQVTAVGLPALLGLPAGSAEPAAHAAENVALQRLEGQDRIATATSVARTGFAGGADTALIARADDFPDAMAAAALAGAYGGPVLLSHNGSVPGALMATLRDLGVKRAVLVGGNTALSPSVAKFLDSKIGRAERVNGNDRYATAAALADEVARVAGIGTLDGKRTALLASGDSFPDALAAGAIAYKGKHPILLTRSGSLPDPTAAAIKRLGIQQVIVLGGTGVVSTPVADAVRSLGVSVDRVGGSTRTDTAARIANLGLARFGLDASAAFLVRGDAFADALVAGPTAGTLGSPILLTATPGQVSTTTQQWFADRCEDVSTIYAVGGSGAISPGAASAARSAAIECRVAGAHGIAGTAVDASNTGPTAYFDPALGRRLTYDDLKPSGSITTSRDGQVLTKLDVTGQITIAHDNVTIRAVRIRNGSDAKSAYSISYAPGSGATGARVEYAEIDGSGATLSVGVVLSHFTMRHSHVRGHRSGMHVGTGGTVEYSYVHSQVLTPGSHNVAMATHGATGVVIRGNNLIGSTSAALSLYPDFAPLQDILIEENLFSGGSYCTYGGSGPKPYAGQTERIRYLNNAFAQHPHARCGHYGPVTVFSTSRPGNQWSGNVWEGSGAAVGPSG